MTIGHKLGLRLFLEGIEVPVIGASITVAANVPTTCSLQVIATDKILEILPRTLVHLFFYDFVGGESSLLASDTKTQEDVENSAYKLFFVGEVQGLAFQKESGARAVMLNCVDLSNYWDTTYQYNFKGSLLGGRQHAAFIGANANFFTSPLGHGVGTIAALLNGKSVNFPNLKGLLAGIVRVLEAIGGAYYGDTTFRGANDFTSIAELRLKILQQITAAEADSSTAKLFARKTFNMWMNRQMGSLGKLVTFRGLTQLLQQFIFHDVYPCPAPKYVPKVSGLKKTKTYATDISKDPRARNFIANVRSLRKLLKSANRNIGDYPAASTTGATRTGPTTTTTVGKEAVIKGLSSDLAQSRRIVDKMIGGGTPNIPGLVKEVQRIDRDLVTIDKNIGRGPSIFSSIDLNVNVERLAIGQLRKAAGNAITDAVAACDTLLGIKVKKSKQITYDKLDRVNNQILRPDIWFVPPPRCNVIFPELYSSINWSRNFLREVSRIELQTTNEILGDDALFNGRYYAPNVVDMRKGLRLSSRQFGRLIMEHELLTGIIPMFEKISEANLFAMKSTKVNHKGAKVGYAQRAVNFQYFKHRFASRQMACSGRFNPWFVPGFPGLILDRPMDTQNLLIAGLPIEEQLTALNIQPETGTKITRGTILREIVPTQFLGCCVQIAHSLNQQGGNTSYAFAQARIHREGSEYLGVDKATISKKLGTARSTTTVGAVDGMIPKKGGRGPRGGRISAVTEVATKGLPVPLLGTNTKAKIGDKVPVWLFKSLYKTAKDKQAMLLVKGYKVTEGFTRRARVKIDLPIEEAIRPPWIWDGYSNLKIGETYMQFFGTNSITDIEGYTSAELLTVYEGADTYTALQEAQEGITYGEQKDQNDQKLPSSYYEEPKQETKARKNRASSTGSQKAETGKKVRADAILAMETDRTIESSIDYLVRIYSFIKHHGLDVGDFLRNYTWRPVATMPEILGSSNFTITEDPPNSGKYVTSGEEGFHSRAFGDVSDLFGLVDPQVKKVLGLSAEKRHTTAKKLDVRGMRRWAIWDYIQELTDSRGLLG